MNQICFVHLFYQDHNRYMKLIHTADWHIGQSFYKGITETTNIKCFLNGCVL